MKTWKLDCSKDAVDIDYTTEIVSDTEPDFWTCETIASEHGCEWWCLDEVESKFRTAIVDETGVVMFWTDTLQGEDQVEAILAAHPEWSCVAIEQSDY